MPIPKTKHVGSVMEFLKKDKPKMPHKQRIAISLNTARRSGANIAKKSTMIGQEVASRAKKKKPKRKGLFAAN